MQLDSTAVTIYTLIGIDNHFQLKETTMKTFVKCLSLFMTILFLGACSTSNNDTENTADEAVAMHKVKHMMGETEIPVKPQRIVDISGLTEELLILGHKPIATANTEVYNLQAVPEHIRKELAGVELLGFYGYGDINVEKIIELAPDLIIMNIRHEKIYDRLTKIAPTVMITDDSDFANWRPRFEELGTYFNQEQEVKDWLANYDARAEEIHNNIIAKKGDENFAVVLPQQKNLYLYADAGVGAIMYKDLQLPAADGVPLDKWGAELDLEGFSLIDADNLLYISSDITPTTLKDSAIWQNRQAVKNNKVYELDEYDANNLSLFPIGKQLLIEKLSNLILE